MTFRLGPRFGQFPRFVFRLTAPCRLGRRFALCRRALPRVLLRRALRLDPRRGLLTCGTLRLSALLRQRQSLLLGTRPRLCRRFCLRFGLLACPCLLECPRLSRRVLLRFLVRCALRSEPRRRLHACGTLRLSKLLRQRQSLLLGARPYLCRRLRLRLGLLARPCLLECLGLCRHALPSRSLCLALCLGTLVRGLCRFPLGSCTRRRLQSGLTLSLLLRARLIPQPPLGIAARFGRAPRHSFSLLQFCRLRRCFFFSRRPLHRSLRSLRLGVRALPRRLHRLSIRHGTPACALLRGTLCFEPGLGLRICRSFCLGALLRQRQGFLLRAR